jgi:hypothetical protein
LKRRKAASKYSFSRTRTLGIRNLRLLQIFRAHTRRARGFAGRRF